jgi:hypothetical protein
MVVGQDMRSSKLITLSLLALAAFSLHGQKKAVDSKARAHEDHSRVNVAFHESDALRGVPASPAMVAPMQCAADGRSFVSMLQPPEFATPLLLSISLSGNRDVRAFHTEQISDLHDMTTLGYFASDSVVSLLVHAAGEDKRVQQTVVASGGRSWQRSGNPSEHHYYVATFDRDGKYKGFVQIDDSIRPHSIGVFPSGVMLISGVVNAHSQFALAKSDGAILRYLDLPQTYSSDLDSKSSAHNLPVGTLMGHEQFVAYRDSIIVVQSGSDLPLLEVTEAGAVRAIHARLGDLLVVDSLLVDGDHLYARSIPKNSTNPVSHSVMEISPQDGSVRREFILPSNIISEIACLHDDAFVSFRYGGEGALIPLLGTPEH